jgi:hypothetical protein
VQRLLWLLALSTIAAASIAPARRHDQPKEVARIDSIASPAGVGSGEPNLTVAPNGRIYMSWLQRADSAHALRFASLNGTTWSAPRTIHTSRDFVVNWADFPSLSVADDQRLAVHWLQKSEGGAYAYGIRIAQSRDGGKSWSAPAIPHRDTSATEHGFVAMWHEPGTLNAVWLDGRNHAKESSTPTNETMLMTTSIGANGAVRAEVALDPRICDCCQTSAAMTSQGPIVVYRDRSANEIRDIYFTRRVNGRWTRGFPVSNDNWRIDGCPVNGPAIAASGNRVVVAWFTAPADKPRVNVAFSRDAGATFGKPVRVDSGNPAGRVDVALMRDGRALVSWVEREGGESATVFARSVDARGHKSSPRAIAASTAARASGFPRMAVSGDHVVFAWTTSATPSSIRVARANVTEFK